MPAGRDQAWSKVGERGEDEQPLAGEPMRNHEIGRLGRIRGLGLRRSLDGDPVAAEDEQVEIQLSRAPALAIAAPERALELLQRGEQGQGTGGRIAADGSVEGDNGIAELGLVEDADRLGRVKPRDTAQSDAGQCRDRPDPSRDGPRGIAEVRPEPDIRPNIPGQGLPPAK